MVMLSCTIEKTRPSGAPGETTVTIELLQGGINQPLKLPDANTAPFLLLSPKNTAEDRPDFEGKYVSIQPNASKNGSDIF